MDARAAINASNDVRDAIIVATRAMTGAGADHDRVVAVLIAHIGDALTGGRLRAEATDGDEPPHRRVDLAITVEILREYAQQLSAIANDLDAKADLLLGMPPAGRA